MKTQEMKILGNIWGEMRIITKDSLKGIISTGVVTSPASNKENSHSMPACKEEVGKKSNKVSGDVYNLLETWQRASSMLS